MGHIRVRKETGKLYFDFQYQKTRCREQTLLDDTPENRSKLNVAMKRIDAEITLGTFDYEKYFPGSKNAEKFEAKAKTQVQNKSAQIGRASCRKECRSRR